MGFAPARPGGFRTLAAAVLRQLGILTLCATLGLIVGLMIVVLPPMAWVSLIGLAIVVLLWVMPDLNLISDAWLRRAFFIAVTTQFALPVYYAFVIPGMPWISIRRVTWFLMVGMVALMISSSKEARERLGALLADGRAVSIPLVGLFVMMALSIATSIAPAESASGLLLAAIFWFMATIASLLVIRTEDDIRTMLKLFCWLGIIGGIAGFIEFKVQRHFLVDFWPKSMIDNLFAQNPALLNNILRDVIRNGLYRANYIYNVSLSFGEFVAICGPISVYFIVHARKSTEVLLGAIGVLACFLGIYASGSRGAYTGFALAVPIVFGLFVIRHMRAHPQSMVGAISGAVLAAAMGMFVIALIAVKKVRWMFTGGYDGAGSTSIRFLQWDLALPHILANPITGHGHGVGGYLVGYYPPGATIPSVDSYVITLLVDIGVPGFLFFFGAALIATVQLIRIYLRHSSEETASSAAIAGAILSFTAYRFALSQQENHTFFFLLLGMAITVMVADRRRRTADRPVRDRVRNRIFETAYGFTPRPSGLESHPAGIPLEGGWPSGKDDPRSPNSPRRPA